MWQRSLCCNTFHARICLIYRLIQNNVGAV